MRIIFTCGGTGGHINPAIAVAKLCQERLPGCEVLFVGAQGGMEEKLVPREGYRLETLKISSLQRKLTPAGIWHNLTTLRNMSGSLRKAKKLIREFCPDVIVGTGGYASFPMLRMGARLGIPTAVHESNAVPGLTTRMVARHVDKIMVSFEDSRRAYADPEKVVVTGTPVRGDFLYTDRAEARRAIDPDDRPLIVSAWGSLGAREMNRKMVRFLCREAGDGLFRHIHATGSYGWRWMPQLLRDAGFAPEEHPELELREYIYDMPQTMAAADLVICRAGAATLSEVCACGVPCIMVPSPNVTDNHQEKNARVLEAHGAAVVLREADCDGDSLYETAKELLCDPQRLRKMRVAARAMAVVDASERILQVIRELSA